MPWKKPTRSGWLLLRKSEGECEALIRTTRSALRNCLISFVQVVQPVGLARLLLGWIQELGASRFHGVV